MIAINWNEYKDFKTQAHTQGDNFDMLLEFLRSYYNMTNPVEIFETLNADELALMMLQKREISDAGDVESYLRNR
ncbi:hypothetical protein KJ877_08255 [bacterium]|nr:hypothetical protein [bacterium]MBU1989407.1 hypothetical protein [bacterium]